MQTVLFQGFPLGLNTSVPDGQLSAKEMPECVNWKINPGGQLESRSAICRYTDVPADGAITAHTNAILGGVEHTIVADDNNDIYYLDGTSLSKIGAASGPAYLFPYNNVCLVCDGSYLKFLSDTSMLRMAYDAGDKGAQFDNYSGTDDSGIKVGDGTSTRAAAKFTSESWDAGFTVPVTGYSCFLRRVGNPTGVITATLRAVADDSVLATTTVGQTAEQISTSGEYVDIDFESVSVEMSPGTEYYACIEYANGDGSNHLELRCSKNGEFVDTGYSYDGSSWTSQPQHNPMIKVGPGHPPKCSFGWVSKSRPWLAGDPDNPSYVWYGNLSHLDFSTGASGGYISVVDNNNTSFPVGAGQDLYGKMFVYGTEAQPFLSRLEGETPESFTLPLMFQQSWATQRTIRNVGNDLWSANSSGVDALSGVQQYGDVRTFSASDRVKDKFSYNWDTAKAFAGYYPDDGQYWLCFDRPGYDKVLVCHTKAPMPTPEGVAYPWVEYTTPCTPKSFGMTEAGFMIGGEDGHLYYFNKNEYKDLGGNPISPKFRTSYVELPFRAVDLTELQLMMSSRTGAELLISIYKDGQLDTSAHDYPFRLPFADNLLIDELLMDIDDWFGAIDSFYTAMFFDLNMHVRSFQVGFSDVKISGLPIFVDGCVVKYRMVDHQ